jgi:hypothetical protein
MTPATPGATSCAPWCTRHHDGGPHPEDAHCTTTLPLTASGEVQGEVLMATDPDTGPVIRLRVPHDEWLLDDAERLGRTLLALAAAGRDRPRTVPAPRPTS